MQINNNTAPPPLRIQFSAFSTDINVFTDAPEPASFWIRHCFCADPEIFHAERGLQLQPRSLILTGSQNIVSAFKTGQAPSPLEQVRIGHGGADIMYFDEAASTAAAYLPENEKAAGRAASNAIPLFTRAILKSSGLFFIHAAAAERDGSAVIFAGENEAGKSSLARSLLMDGWNLLSDDNLPLLMRNGVVCALPVREAFNATSLENAQIEKLLSTGFTKSTFPGFLHPRPLAAEPAPVKAVFYPKWSGTAAGASPAPRPFALKTIYSLCKTPLFSTGLRGYDEIAGALATQGEHFFYHLKKGAWFDPAELLSAVERVS